jgi:trehalose 6-phosphate synthase
VGSGTKSEFERILNSQKEYPLTANGNTNGDHHIVIVSNRGPFSFTQRESDPQSGFDVQRGSGGLVTAISAVASQYDLLWISCALGKGDKAWLQSVGNRVAEVDNMKIRLIDPDPVQYERYYNVISNPLLWFVQHQLHDTPRSPIIDGEVWTAWTDGYAAINRQFAQAVADSIADLDGTVIVMVQDYHLYLFARFLRELVGDRVIIHQFLHIPFPGADTWRILPIGMRAELLDGMLHADRIGFQTERDTRRFLQTVVDNLSEARVLVPWRALSYRGRRVDASPYPISIDVQNLLNIVASEEAQQHIHSFIENNRDRRMILRVDRVEPSKNILRGLIAFRNMLLAYPEHRGKCYMLALLVPSRMEVGEYQTYLRDIMALVGEINATLGQSDWEPVRVMLGNNYTRALAALSIYDVLLVNPLADGMNLVAKEGVIVNQKAGVLILSEEAGVAEEFGSDALMVAPYDVFGTREALHMALMMADGDRQARAARLAEHVRQNDIHHWFTAQLDDLQVRTQ